MRLLNVNTRQLEEFYGDAIPPYAILSHTWGKEEVTLQDLSREGHQQKQGYAKIEGCCQQAMKDDLLWIWVDTCCIDKTSSAELSEAINSMYRWYKNSKVCYAYLQDVPSGTDIYEQNSAFRKSRWFSRGWTLQELLAPLRLQFHDTNWAYIFLLDYSNTSEKGSIDLLSDITSIDKASFRYYNSGECFERTPSAARVFSWMARRSTTRVEDKAYCMLGLLKINMPLLYGEGEKAFARLQEAILSNSEDISLLTWGYHTCHARVQSYLASSPEAFLGYPKENYYPRPRITRMHTTVTGRGLHIELYMILIDARNKVWLGIVEEEVYGRKAIAIVLQQIWDENLFMRVSSCPPVPIRTANLSRRRNWAIKRKQTYITHVSDDDDYVDRWNIAIPTQTNLERLLSCGQLKLRTRLPVHVHPIYRVETQFFHETGYSFSSSWPPVAESGDLDRPMFVCSGPHDTLFYMVFSNGKQDRFAVKIKIEWGKHFLTVVETAFCVLTGEYTDTALEHCCGTKIGSKVPQFANNMHWKPYFTANNVTTDEIGYVCVTYLASNPAEELSHCELVWKKGLRQR